MPIQHRVVCAIIVREIIIGVYVPDLSHEDIDSRLMIGHVQSLVQQQVRTRLLPQKNSMCKVGVEGSRKTPQNAYAVECLQGPPDTTCLAFLHELLQTARNRSLLAQRISRLIQCLHRLLQIN